jgi:hypothetical protein
MTQQWNSGHACANIALSGSPLLSVSITGSFGNNSPVYATEYVSSGFFYWEVSFPVFAGIGIGTAAETVALGDFIGKTGNLSIGWSAGSGGSGNVFLNGSAIANVAQTGAVGGYGCIALDATNGLIYFRNNTNGTGLWNDSGSANPSTQTGGISIAAVLANGSVTPGCWLFNAGDTAVGDFAPSSWQGTAPSGFGPFDPASQGTRTYHWNLAVKV